MSTSGGQQRVYPGRSAELRSAPRPVARSKRQQASGRLMTYSQGPPIRVRGPRICATRECGKPVGSARGPGARWGARASARAGCPFRLHGVPHASGLKVPKFFPVPACWALPTGRSLRMSIARRRISIEEVCQQNPQHPGQAVPYKVQLPTVGPEGRDCRSRNVRLALLEACLRCQGTQRAPSAQWTSSTMDRGLWTDATWEPPGQPGAKGRW